MSQVFYIKEDKNELNFKEIPEKLFEKFGNLFDKNDKTAIKMHFGERKSNTHLSPSLVEPIYDKINQNTKKTSLMDCNVLYRGDRSIGSTHKKLAKENGFKFGNIVIADGEKGEDEISIEINQKNFDKVKVGRKLKNYNFLFSLAHLTGHEAAGYGGALKNVGMGLGSKSGKLEMHEAFNLEVERDECQACGTCIRECPEKAIRYVEGKANIDKEKCIGCGICIAVCPFEAIQIPWGDSSPRKLQERIVETAYGILQNKEKSLFMNVLYDITPECDCVNQEQECIVEDKGILISDDIVSIDQASLDLIGLKNFPEDIDSEVQVTYAEKLGMGERDYELKEI
ncbi:4Fe-4S ferredoxin [archaeon SCG-AAA382B04]|nr:4Fe-4S ferredoxin [archaeon SCG-AAA382B04]